MQRPERLDFLRVQLPGRPVCLTWRRPPGRVEGYMVLATQNPFPPELTAEIWRGRMDDFVYQVRTNGTSTEFRSDEAAGFYAVLAVQAGDVWLPVQNLREDSDRTETPLALSPVEVTQERTFVRARWTPLPSVERDREVHVWRLASPPAEDHLGSMVLGLVPPHHRLDPSCDGFIDTITEEGFRVYYVAVAVDLTGGRRPLRLITGAFQRLEAPAFLEAGGYAKHETLVQAVVDQLELELQLSDTTAEELRARLARADDLAPRHPDLARIAARARKRFGAL